MAELPQLTSLHVSSISVDQIANDLPTTITYDQPITIHASAKTDMWRHPPDIDVNNAPTRLISTPIGIHKFRSARVTVSADWNNLYDQGGLVFFIPAEDMPKWLKAGIEVFGEDPCVSSVNTNRWSDAATALNWGKEKGGKLTIQAERQLRDGKKLDSLWIYIIDEETGRKMEIRRIAGWFSNDIPVQKDAKETPDNRCLLVGVYAGRGRFPPGEGREHEELVVKFEGFEVKLFDD